MDKEASTPRPERTGAKILDLVGRAKGAALTEIMKATDWQAHSARSLLSTAVKKQGLKIESTKTETSDRVYQKAEFPIAARHPRGRRLFTVLRPQTDERRVAGFRRISYMATIPAL
jgi:hypothetical protein